MIERELAIRNRLGLHARAAAKFVQTASRYKSAVKIRKNEEEVDGNPDEKPERLPVIAESIPDCIKQTTQWVVWKFAWNESKWDKPLYNARTLTCEAAAMSSGPIGSHT